MKVYLAGPITGLSYGKSTSWRDYATEILAPWNIKGISPMRAKEYLSNEETIQDAYDTHMSCDKGIVTRDRFDVTNSDIMLAYLLDANQASIGTAIEYGWADAARKPIVTVMDTGDIHNHAMIRAMSGYIVPSLDEALEIIIAICH